ncbi:6-phosphogluconolactonase [Cochlodiniinecator piscidefendens]|uniref:6-phosphogluconolactonase n=1 Tax=Cochlodiniinecator piscidefendens TaxID=2715756 RepID=UPI0014075B87|nr:6-phosphogluconolactonase [Cochlodiniinecator piscidefendens]
MNIVEYADREMMMMDLATILADEIKSQLHHEDRVTLAVPGGTTPGPIFDGLSAVDLGWDRVDVMLTDERWVSETSERSNTRLLQNRLLTGYAQAANLIPLYETADTPEEALPNLRKNLSPHLPINVLLLGMGADMHTASLFPGADRLEEAFDPLAPVLLPMRADGADEPRITLTVPALQSAMTTHIVIAGQEKREAIKVASKTKDFKQAPIAAFLNNATIHWADE